MSKMESIVVFLGLSECGDWEEVQSDGTEVSHDARVRFDLDSSIVLEHINCSNGNITPGRLNSFCHSFTISTWFSLDNSIAFINRIKTS